MDSSPNSQRRNRKLFLSLSGCFAATAIAAAIQGWRDGWNIGDTIGACFFLLLAGLTVYEVLRSRAKG